MRTKIPTVKRRSQFGNCRFLSLPDIFTLFSWIKFRPDEKEDKIIDWADITNTRYIDWSMTTPLMLLALCLVLSQNIGKSVKFQVFFSVIILNFAMLYVGYLGENKQMHHTTSMLLGFVALLGMFYLIFTNYVLPKYMYSNYIIFTIFFMIWSLYGVFYMLSESYKNIGMNILDCLAKCCFGLGLWAYYSRILAV
jgi:bacteriorhodopsin